MSANRFTLRRRALLLAAALACTSCLRNHYVIEMKPVGNAIERKISIFNLLISDTSEARGPASLGDIEASWLKSAYGVRPDTIRPYIARRRFKDIPRDVGNHGAYRTSRTVLGLVAVYVEGFRGEPRSSVIFDILDRTRAGPDSLIELARVWCAAEVGRHPRWPALDAYLDGELRNRLRDFVGDNLLTDLSEPRAAWGAVMLALIEHPETVGLMYLGSEYARFGEPLVPRRAGLDSLQAHFARALGLRTAAEVRRDLGFLADPARARASMVNAIAAARGISPDSAGSLWFRAGNASLVTSGYDTDSLVVRLATGVQPNDTNGEWDAASRQVSWRAEIPAPPEGVALPPTFCYASWSIPDSTRQRRLFGRVLLRGYSLTWYGTMFAGLDAARQREWDRTLTALKPGDLSPLERFRFADERARGAPGRDTTSLAAPLVKLILDAARREP